MIARLHGRAAINRWAGICEQQAGVVPEFDAIEAGEAQLVALVREEGRIGIEDMFAPAPDDGLDYLWRRRFEPLPAPRPRLDPRELIASIVGAIAAIATIAVVVSKRSRAPQVIAAALAATINAAEREEQQP